MDDCLDAGIVGHVLQGVDAVNLAPVEPMPGAKGVAAESDHAAALDREVPNQSLPHQSSGAGHQYLTRRTGGAVH